jgi:hypothetical protein
VDRKNGLDDAMAGVGDALRYTAIIPTDSYASGINAVLDGLRARGYDVPKVENMWDESNMYRAIHADVTSPDGVRIELQFHTPESIAVKGTIHKDYELAREPSTDPQERWDAYERMLKAWDGQKPPPGIEGIGQPRLYPPPVDQAAVKADLLDKYDQALTAGDKDALAALRERATALGIDLPKTSTTTPAKGVT